MPATTTTQLEVSTRAQTAPRWTFAGSTGTLSGACWHHEAIHEAQLTPAEHVIVLHSGGFTSVRRFDEKGRLTANGSRLQTFAIMPAGSCSIWEIDDPCDLIHLYVPVGLLEHHAQQHGLSHAPPLAAWFDHDDPWLAGLFRMIRAEISSEANGVAATLLLDEIGTSLARHLLARASVDAVPVSFSVRPRGGLSPWALRRVVDAMRADLAATHRITDLAAGLAMSDDHFIRAFRQSVGTSPHRHLVALRMEQAKRLFKAQPHTSVGDVSRSCGFTSTAHFSQQFRRATGVTPREWRRGK